MHFPVCEVYLQEPNTYIKKEKVRENEGSLRSSLVWVVREGFGEEAILGGTPGRGEGSGYGEDRSQPEGSRVTAQEVSRQLGLGGALALVISLQRGQWGHLLCFLGAALSPPLCLLAGPWHSEKDYFNPCGKWVPKYGPRRVGGLRRFQLRAPPPAPPPAKHRAQAQAVRPVGPLLGHPFPSSSPSHTFLLAPCPPSHPLFVQEPSVFCRPWPGTRRPTCPELPYSCSQPGGTYRVLGGLSRGGDI